MKKYYFYVKETDDHDQELDVIEAESLEKAQIEFELRHPEDKGNIDCIIEENEFTPVWQSERENEQ
jgi:hypothetical protein